MTSMRIIDIHGNTLDRHDLEDRCLTPAIAIRQNAKPVDNVSKFAWDDDDYEEVLVYTPAPIVNPYAPLTDEEKLALFAKTIPEEKYPDVAPKAGYKYQREYSIVEHSIVWVLVADPANPIEFIEGMGVTEGLYYNNGTSKYLCIQCGTPESLENEVYFTKV